MMFPNFNSLILAILFLTFSSAQINLYSTPFIDSSTSQFGRRIEGASVNANGDMFATNFGANLFAIGSITPSQSVYHTSSSPNSFYNSIRFIPLTKTQVYQGVQGVALLANVKENQITKIVVDKDGYVEQSAICMDQTLSLPNDLSYSYETNRIYISGQNITANTVKGDGGLWVCDGKSGIVIDHVSFGRTNGIEISPDENTLYISETLNKDSKVVSNKIWRFNIDKSTGKVSNQELFVDFEILDGTQAIDIDGMKTDIDGNLYVTRHDGSHVSVFDPLGNLLSKIYLSSIKKPTNLEFGGDYGKTLFIVGACIDDGTKGCVETILSDVPGRAFTALKSLNGKLI
ncbi:1750_t:CDS:1 [Funneliformis geosporum]|uniref:3698_t:CDS:1 n=1 Tax=Funneliformis geosporum TaxID=1117311 RepID=A0A9W4WNM7_9GLOM|nr:3698_t:CDS:1 [Funneliformis geosporum]CAI2199309.1 1750_t:CDS:1 [Funneliformis geosporum]